MKTTFNFHSLLVALFVLTLNATACNNFELENNYPEKNDRDFPNSSSSVMDEPLEDGTAPEENIITFKITPEDGWEIRPGEILLFQAWLWDEEKETYIEVTNSPDCKFHSAHFGKSVDGNDPSLTNGQEITIRAIYNGISAQTTGTFRAN